MCSDCLRMLVPAFLVAACSCSVKEDRDRCPCVLALELSDLPVTPVMLKVEVGEFVHTEVVHRDTVVVLQVPKGKAAVSAVGGALPEGNGGVRIPEGEEAPALYLFHADTDLVSEQLVLPVILRKQFCRLDLVFKGPPGYGPPFEAEVEGFQCGWLRDGTPMPGAFRKRLLPGPDGTATLRLPRQGDDSLLMQVFFSDKVVRTFALGQYIAAAGYDWSAPDLDDLTLTVDISVTSVTISTDAWTRTEEIELFI